MQIILGSAETAKLPKTVGPTTSDAQRTQPQNQDTAMADTANAAQPDFTALFDASTAEETDQIAGATLEVVKTVEEQPDPTREGDKAQISAAPTEQDPLKALGDSAQYPKQDRAANTTDLRVGALNSEDRSESEREIKQAHTSELAAADVTIPKTKEENVAGPREQQTPRQAQHILETALSVQRVIANPADKDAPVNPAGKVQQNSVAPSSPIAVPETTATLEANEQNFRRIEPSEIQQVPARSRSFAFEPGGTAKASFTDVQTLTDTTDPRSERNLRFADVPTPAAVSAPEYALKPAQTPSPQVKQVYSLNDFSAKFAQEVTPRLQGEPTEIIQWDLRASQTVTPQSNQTATILARTELPPNIASQIAVALQKGGDKPIEIALNPPELGRVRMVLNASEAGMVVQVLTDRTDTLDLMRRNIDDLGRALTDLGYEDLSFAFGQSDDGNTSEDHPDRDTTKVDLAETTNTGVDTNLTLTPLMGGNDGVDIRI